MHSKKIIPVAVLSSLVLVGFAGSPAAFASAEMSSLAPASQPGYLSLNVGGTDDSYETDYKTGEPLPQAEAAEPVGLGYSVNGRYNNGDYILHLIDSPNVESIRSIIVAAANDANSTGATNIQVASGLMAVVPEKDKRERGHIYLLVSSQSGCTTPNWLGCANTGVDYEDGVKKLLTGTITIKPESLLFQSGTIQHIVAHEIGHVLGLGHYSDEFEGKLQTMYPTLGKNSEYPKFLSGDRLGLNYLKHPVPRGMFDSLNGALDSFTINGWAVDELNANPVDINVIVDGNFKQRVKADKLRADVGAATGKGNNHGFNETIAFSRGVHTVCLTAAHAYSTISGDLGCKTVTVGVQPSRGALDSVVVKDGGVVVSGWSYDKSSPESSYIWVNVDGQGKAYQTNTDKTWLPNLIAGAGVHNGFEHFVGIRKGTHEVCVYGAESSLLGCKTVTVLKSADAASDAITGVSGGIRVQGWAIDLTNPTVSSYVWVDVSGAGQAVKASLPLSWFDGLYPGAGANHGFDQVIAKPKGTYNVCVSEASESKLLQCKTVTVP